jgi:outer membrane protein insertion porin family
MRRSLLVFFCGIALLGRIVLAQSAVDRPEELQKRKAKNEVTKTQEKVARYAANIELRGEKAFSEKELRSQLKEQITTIETYGLSAARGDDAAFFLELFYRKHGYARVDVRYSIQSGGRLVLDIYEGPLITLGLINFIGNNREPADKLFEYAVGPTRERYSKLQKKLPFVEMDIKEGADLVHRFYVSEGFIDSMLDPPHYTNVGDGTQTNVTIAIHEGRQYFFGRVAFSGQTIYGDQALLGQLGDLVNKPYTDARVADIPRRLQTYFKARGYYDVKVDAVGNPVVAQDGHVPVEISVQPGPVYHFDGTTVTGLTRLHPDYVTKRFRKLNGKTYSPEVIDERFRELMRTGLFNLLQIKPTPVGDNLLRLDITAEEAKSKEFGLSVGYGSYVGPIFGIQFRDLDLFGYGRPLSTSLEITGRSYKGEIAYEDPYLFDSDFHFKSRLYALSFDFDGYSKFELGGRIDLSRQFTKHYNAGLILWTRHVEITENDIRPPELAGPTNYFVSSFGFTQTLDLRDSPVVPTRGFIFDNTFDLATSALSSDIDFVRSTFRVSYYLSFAKTTPTASDIGTEFGDKGTASWFERSGLAFGARMGIIHSLNSDMANEAFAIPIDERFFNGGSTTVRSFGERTLGPHDRRGHPIGGEFYTIFNIEYTFPVFGELEGVIFTDAGNLLPSSEDIGLADMRYAIGAGLRYRLPIGPLRLDYGVNPDPREDEDRGAFHFSFGFAF